MQTYNLKGTETAINLMKSFAGESQARNRYTFYESVARNEGYIEIADIFYETAENERAHAKRLWDCLIAGGIQENALDIEAAFPVAMKDTGQNLGYAAIGEHEEGHELYPTFANIADQEGFPTIAAIFRAIASVEKFHEERFLQYKKFVDTNQVFTKEKSTQWICINCGYIHEGNSAPNVCPSCAYPQGYFKEKA